MKNIKKQLKKSFKIIQKARKQTNNTNILITVFAIVMIWRGTWGILDKILFPNNEILSYITSILLGVLILWIEDKKIRELLHH